MGKTSRVMGPPRARGTSTHMSSSFAPFGKFAAGVGAGFREVRLAEKEAAHAAQKAADLAKSVGSRIRRTEAEAEKEAARVANSVGSRVARLRKPRP